MDVIKPTDRNETFILQPEDCEYCTPGTYMPLMANMQLENQQWFRVRLAGERLRIDIDHDTYYLRVNYCPICGRKLRKGKNDE